jgi:hypothetical protein
LSVRAAASTTRRPTRSADRVGLSWNGQAKSSSRWRYRWSRMTRRRKNTGEAGSPNCSRPSTSTSVPATRCRPAPPGPGCRVLRRVPERVPVRHPVRLARRSLLVRRLRRVPAHRGRPVRRRLLVRRNHLVRRLRRVPVRQGPQDHRPRRAPVRRHHPAPDRRHRRSRRDHRCLRHRRVVARPSHPVRRHRLAPVRRHYRNHRLRRRRQGRHRRVHRLHRVPVPPRCPSPHPHPHPRRRPPARPRCRLRPVLHPHPLRGKQRSWSRPSPARRSHGPSSRTRSSRSRPARRWPRFAASLRRGGSGRAT